MKNNFIKDFFNVTKYKRKANTWENKYKSVLPEKVKELDYVVELQRKVITLQDKIIENKDELLEYREQKIKKLKESRKKHD